MSIRVLVIGASSASLRAVVGSFSDSLDLSVIAGCDHEDTARRALLHDAPDVAIVSSELVDGSGIDLLASLAPGERPPAIVVVSRRDDDAVRAFALQATDFVREPVSAARLFDALVRARHQALQAALLKTADELQRLLGEVANGAASSRADRLLAVSGARRDGFSDQSEAWHAERVTDASLADATLAEASLTEASLTEASLTEASLTEASLTDAQFAAASFAAASFADASFADASFADASFASSGARGALVRPAADGPLASGRPLAERVLDLASEPGAPTGAESRPTRVLVREGRRTRFVPLVDVDWFEADGNYIVVRAGAETYRTRGTVSAIERVLDPAQFVRIHRRTVVNMDRVRELTPLPGGDGLLTLGDGTTLRLSRTYRARVR